jgi:hypothetical protein
VLSPTGQGEWDDKCVQVLVGNRERKHHLEDVVVDGRIIIK